jgi:hypothetical protein
MSAVLNSGGCDQDYPSQELDTYCAGVNSLTDAAVMANCLSLAGCCFHRALPPLTTLMCSPSHLPYIQHLSAL